MADKQCKEVLMDQLMPIMKEQLALGQKICFSPQGVSMLPMLRQGMDSVTVSPILGALKKYDIPLYQRANGSYVLHRIVTVKPACTDKAIEDVTYTCIGDNQFVYEKGIRQEQLIAVVSSFHRNGKEIPVTSFTYRCYVRLWDKTRLLRRVYRALKRRICKCIKK